MEDSREQLSDGLAEKADKFEVQDESPVTNSEIEKRVPASAKSDAARKAALGTAKKKVELQSKTDSSSSTLKSNRVVSKPSATGSSHASSSISAIRRNSTGGLPEQQTSSSLTRRQSSNSSAAVTKGAPSASEPSKRSAPEIRRSSLPSALSKLSSRMSSDSRKLGSVSPHSQSLRTSSGSDVIKQDVAKIPNTKPALSGSSSKKAPSSSVDSSASSKIRRPVSTVSSPSTKSPSITSRARTRDLSSSSERRASVSSRKKAMTPESRDSRFVVLPQVEIKAGDDVRLDLRGHRVRSLNATGLNLSPSLEFVYLRDNLLSTLEGIEILKRVKVLDLSFNDFKGPGFEPLENCKNLQQLYLAGNQITSLVSLPELPNLEFLSVAQNKLKSLSMATQPRLQVLAASKNKISTLKGFPHLPVLEHLRLEDNPILKMPHLEAASILLIGVTLKKFNDRDLLKEELVLSRRYPPQTSLCIRYGWEFCRPDHAAVSTSRFLIEKWKDQLPPGYLLKEAFVEKPFEGDTCRCVFNFDRDVSVDIDSSMNCKYQWFIGGRTPANFIAISDASEEVYWPNHEDVGKILKVECTPVIGDIEYPSIFAISSPVSRGTGYPKVVDLDVCGELVEGNIVKGYAQVAWCGGTPGKGVASWLRRKWNGTPVVIVGAEDEEYLLTMDDIDCSLVFMYTPVTEEGAKGEPQYKYTDFVKAAPPSVTNVRITGDAVEECTIKGEGDYFGGREGPSKFQWLRETKETGEFELVSTGTAEYVLTKEDVSRRLAFKYVPINFEGQEGESVSVLSETITQAPPRVTNLKIIGDVKENSKISVTANVSGGTEGSSKVQWFKTHSSAFTNENGLEALSTSKVAKAFRIPLGAVGYYIVAKFIPMTPDGESGEAAYVISNRMVETLPPALNFLSITGDYIEGGMLTASYGYIGGHEGKSIYTWYLHEAETDPGRLMPEVSGFLQYRITKDAVGRFISFQCAPVRDDGSVGEPRTCMGQERIRPGSPKLLSLQIVGAAVEGSKLSVDKKYWGGEEGESLFRWCRTGSDGSQHEVKGATTSSYTLSIDDIGSFVSVSCEPVRSDWARGPIVLSQRVGPIAPGPPTCQSLEYVGSMLEGHRLSFIVTYTGGEKGNCIREWFRVDRNGVKVKVFADEFLDLSLDDVGKWIELVYTPVRKDGAKGSPRIIVSDVIAPGEPLGVELIVPECYEGRELVLRKTYFGGEEGIGDCIWYRTKQKIDGSALTNISDSHDDVCVCSRTLMYTPSLEDVGAYLALYWVPTRSDGKCGKPLVSISNSLVLPGTNDRLDVSPLCLDGVGEQSTSPPVVSNVHVKQLSSSVYCGEGEYFGGFEGSSLFSWYRKTSEGTISLIDGANHKTYEVTDSDYACRLLFGYTPVRSDSDVGELKLSEPSDVILPEPLKIEMLALTGKAIEGDILTAVQVIPETETQHNVWNKYKKIIKYQWFSCIENGEKFEPLPSRRSCSYKVRLEDIGQYLKCECIVTDAFGRSTEPAYAETGPILPGFPKIEKLEIEGRGFHTNLYAVRGTYSGGKEGKSRIQWLRSMVGSPDLISIPGETGRMYEANVDDVGYRLVAIYTPVREDGIEGQPISASTDSITTEPDVLKEVKQNLDLGAVKFEALCDKDRTPKKVPGLGSLERRVLEVNRKRVKVVKPGSKTSFPTTEVRGSYAPPFHVEVFRSDQHRLRIVVDSDNEVDLMVQTRHQRDVVVLVIRGLAQRFNSTSLNTLLKIET